MANELDGEQARERVIHEICKRIEPNMADLLGDALRTRRGLNFGTSDPEVMKLLAQLKALDGELDPPKS